MASHLAGPVDAGPFAAMGSVLHKIAESLMRGGSDDWLTASFGAALGGGEFEHEGHTVKVGPEEMELVMTAVRTPQMLQRRRYELEYEVKVAPPVDTPASLDGMRPWGTADVIGWRPATQSLAVVDYKFGNERVEIGDQPRFYGVGAVDRLRRQGEEPKHVSLFIVQPKHEDCVRRLDLTVDELDAWARDELQPAVDACCAPDPAYNADPAWCRRCPARHRCPEIARIGREMMAPGVVAPALALSMTNDEIVSLLHRAEIADIMIASLRAEAERRLAAGDCLPGWRLVDRRPVRKWIKPEAEIVGSLLERGFREDEFMPRALLTPPALEKRSRKAFRAVEGFVQPVSSGKKLGRAEDLLAIIEENDQ